MDDYKARIKKSIMKLHKKELREHTKITKPRDNPEERFAELELRPVLTEMGFDVAKTDSGHKDYEQARVDEVGHSDYSGDFHGLAVFIETKAPGRRKYISGAQYMFLRRKIQRGCFACVTDSVDHFTKLWGKFLTTKDYDLKIELLMKDLPIDAEVERIERPGPLFSE